MNDDRKPRKCSRCTLNTFDPIGTCSACETLPLPVMKWYIAVMRPSLLKCTFYRNGAACGNEAYAVQHGLRGMTGKHGCEQCIARERIAVSTGKGGYNGSHHHGRARALPPSSGIGFHSPRNRARIKDERYAA